MSMVKPAACNCELDASSVNGTGATFSSWPASAAAVAEESGALACPFRPAPRRRAGNRVGQYGRAPRAASAAARCTPRSRAVDSNARGWRCRLSSPRVMAWGRAASSGAMRGVAGRLAWPTPSPPRRLICAAWRRRPAAGCVRWHCPGDHTPRRCCTTETIRNHRPDTAGLHGRNCHAQAAGVVRAFGEQARNAEIGQPPAIASRRGHGGEAGHPVT